MSKRIERIVVMLLVVSLCAPAAFADLRAHYTFDDGTANDSSGNGAHAQPQGNAKVVEDTDLVPGEVFMVMEFGGGDDVLVTPGLTVQEKVPTMTFATWIKPREETFEGDRRSSLISHTVVPWVDGTIHFMLRYRALAFSVKNDTPASLAGTIEFEADQWYHVAVVRDGTDMIAYVNGQEDTRVTGTKEITFSDGFNIGAHANASRQFYGRMDDIRIYDHALTADELLAIALAPFPSLDLASSPNPVNGKLDAARDVQLSWMPGEGAGQHDVYFGTSFVDVNTASTTNDPAGVYRDRQATTTYTPGLLEFGQTYYWRIDEVKTVGGVYKGPVWEFTVEPFGYALSDELITATASSSAGPDTAPDNTINGSGLDENDLHSTETTDMWLSNSAGPQPTWIEYEFDKVYRLHQMHVWNHNGFLERVVGFGIKEATVECSADGIDWTAVGTTHEFAQGASAPGYAANTIVDLSGVAAKYVRITANSNWGGLGQYGLSEVRFLYVPVWAREPEPASGAEDMDVENVVLRWRAGQEAATHDLYLSTDEQAVIDETIDPVSVPAGSSYASYATGPLDLAQTYYWKVNEVNKAQSPTTWQGDVSSFSTRESLLVDDFELYNDLDPTDPDSNRVFFAWRDGLDQPTNGSVVGYAEAPFCEQTIVHGGNQSMPLSYDNSTATYSEATVNIADLPIGSNWSQGGIKTLSLWFHGTAGNTGQLYVKINGVKIPYDGDASNLAIPTWQPWNIDLVALSADLQNVTMLAIGVDDNGATGTLFVDDIRLYAYERQLATPVEPDPVNLAGHWQFDGNLNDSSGNARHGAAVGDPVFTVGKTGQAIELDGVDDYVTITGYKGILADAGGVQQPFTLTAWVKTTDSGDRTIASWGTNTSMLRVDFRLFEGRLRVEHGSGNRQGDTTLNDGNWHHVALIMNQGATVSHPDVQLWLDGKDDTRAGTSSNAFSITADVDMAIGCRVTALARYFLGTIDDVCLYDRVLSQEEMVWLAGRTLPYDKPF